MTRKLCHKVWCTLCIQVQRSQHITDTWSHIERPDQNFCNITHMFVAFHVIMMILIQAYFFVVYFPLLLTKYFLPFFCCCWCLCLYKKLFVVQSVSIHLSSKIQKHIIIQKFCFNLISFLDGNFGCFQLNCDNGIFSQNEGM